MLHARSVGAAACRAALSGYTAEMFTGLIEAQGRVLASEARAFGRRITVAAGEWRGRGRRLEAGDSVAVNGVCLTVAAATDEAGGTLHFDVIPETLAGSTLGELAPDEPVNLESALLATTPLGGHFVQGHVDAVGRITEVRGDESGEGERAVVVQPPKELLALLPPKGSVAVEGVSLTIASSDEETFEVALIPTTLEQTTLGRLRIGDRVNIETDVLTRAAVHALRRWRAGDAAKDRVSWRTLREAGFVE